MVRQIWGSWALLASLDHSDALGVSKHLLCKGRGKGGKDKGGGKKSYTPCGTAESVWYNTNRQKDLGWASLLISEGVLKDSSMPSCVWQCLNYGCNVLEHPSDVLPQNIFSAASLVSLSTSLETSINIFGSCSAGCANQAYLCFHQGLLSVLPPFPLPPSPPSKAAICSF